MIRKISLQKNKIIRSCVFFLFGLFALHIPFSLILGANVKFTLFDFFAPTIGAFIGPIAGIATILFTQLFNIVIMHQPFEIATIIRLFPILFAVLYFSKRTRINFIIPLLCMVAFNLNPIGRSAWQYSLFWLIPAFSYFFGKNTFIKSLGATFSAHAVGGALWVWTFGLSKEIWLALIPQTMMERLLMAGGITVFYAIINWAIKINYRKYVKQSPVGLQTD
jgi:hypothetical protein